MHYGSRAKDWITDHDITQKKLAKEFHITEAMFSNYLNGRNDMPIEILVKIAQYFHITTDYLVGLSDSPLPAIQLSRGERDAAARKERLVDAARLEGRKALLQAKQDMVGRAFDLALEKLSSLPEEEYVALLARLAVSAARTGREQVILSQRDRSRYGKQIVTRANELLAREVAPRLPEELTSSRAGAVLDKVVARSTAVLAGTGMLTLAEETRPMAGGLVLRDGRVETNCSFEALIYLQRDALSAQVAKVLFP